MKIVIKIFFILLVPLSLKAEIYVVISDNSNIDNITKNELSNLYLKKTDRIHGQKVVVVNNVDDYDEFNKKVLNKTPSQIHAYWMKQIFLGRKVPPKKVDEKEIQRSINNLPNVITYTSKKINAKVIYAIN
ncbi:MAG: hypothetical protein ABGW74_05630 [Campylobacterales bacterium]